MSGILNVVQKEFAQLKRDPFRLRLILLVPVVQVVLLGYAANLDVKKIPTAVVDMDRSTASRKLAARLFSSGYFVPVDAPVSPEDVSRLLERGTAAFVVVVPKGFHADLEAGRPAPLQVLVDGTDATFSARSLSYASTVVRTFSKDVVLDRVARAGRTRRAPPGIDARIRIWFNPQLLSRWFFVPGILALILMIITTLGTAVSLVREKEMGTMEQLIVTPLRPYELILGKLIPNAVVGMVEVLVVLAVVVSIFGIPIRGSIALLLAMCGLFLLTTLGLGLLISTVSRTQQQAMMAAIFFVMIPMILLSGFVFPIENMPRPIQAITYFIPLRYFFVIIRGLFLKDVGLMVLWDEALALLVFGVLVLGLSANRFQKRLG